VRDIYEAAEKHSATLALYVEHIARRRGWGARTLSGMLLGPEDMNGHSKSGPRMMMIYGASVLLPEGRAVSFIPSRTPRVDGDTWTIDIKRSDGVSRPAWNRGIAIKRVNGAYAITLGEQLLDETALAALLEAVGTP
jgi:hypothetical protein